MAADGLTVTVTGPTGDLGIALVDALERSRRVKRIVGMARRPFDPASQGWKKTEYREGDVQDRESVADAVKGADVVVHLAFAILASSDRTRGVNIDGSRNVFEEAVAAGAERICYASSVAAYGFHDDNPDWLHEEIPPRGSDAHFYSAQKAEVEGVLGEALVKATRTQAWVFRPCIVAGPKAQTMIEEIPYVRMSQAMPDPVRRLLSGMPVLKPVIPDPGIPFQLVHEDDVAQAFVARRPRQGRAGPLQPRRQRNADDVRPRRRTRLVLDPDPGARGRRHRRGGGSPPRQAAGLLLDRERAQAGADEDRQGEEAPRLEARSTRRKATLKDMVAAYRDEQRF